MIEVPGKRPRGRPKWRYCILVREGTKIVGKRRCRGQEEIEKAVENPERKSQKRKKMCGFKFTVIYSS